MAVRKDRTNPGATGTSSSNMKATVVAQLVNLQKELGDAPA